MYFCLVIIADFEHFDKTTEQSFHHMAFSGMIPGDFIYHAVNDIKKHDLVEMYSKAGNQYILWHRKENSSCFHEKPLEYRTDRMRISVPVIVIIGTDQITQILFLQQKQYNFRVMVHDFDMMDVFYCTDSIRPDDRLCIHPQSACLILPIIQR